MIIFIDLISWALIILGSFVLLSSGVGLLRFPDFYTRTHATSLIDTLGAGSLLLALCLQAGFSLVTLKLLFILIFLLFTSPAINHALVKIASINNLKPLIKHKIKGKKE